MAFQLSDHLSGAPFQVDVLRNNREFIARLMIGADEETGVVFSAVVVLTSQPNLSAGQMELMFGIVEAALDGSTSTWINDGAQTRAFLKGESRKRVLDSICIMAQAVAEAAQPSVISFVTAVPDLPGKALTKYGHICKALRGAGYRGGKGDSYHGSEIWMLTRRPDGP